ncbi:MAG: ComEC/Rec2 family competence protein, partial [Pseudomonadales bacterium]|nr:ComEC/Rec2 family competence protein [Pseudomonadales bacterium]
MAFLLAFSGVVFSIRWQSELLPMVTILPMVLFASLVWLLSRHAFCVQRKPLSLLLSLLAALLFGLSYSHFYAGQLLSKRLPHAYWNSDIPAVIDIVSLPVEKGRARQFQAVVVAVDAADLQGLIGEKLLLKSYRTIHVDIKACQRWQVVMRLKPVHSLKNGAGFDYQGFLFQQGIQIRGYLRSAQQLHMDQTFCIAGLREKWRRYLLTLALQRDTVAWLIALSVGDKSLLNTAQKSLLQLTGTFHLFVISGLHIGLVAGFVYAAVLLLRRLGGAQVFSGDWRPVASVLGLMAAIAYGLMAGWQLPVQRAVLTLFIFMSTSLLGLRWSLWRRFIVAVFLILCLQPMAGLNGGFILSFSAVFFLIWVNQYCLSTVALKAGSGRGLIHAFFSSIRQLLLLQAAISLALMPFLLLFFQQWSWLMLLVNLIFIPLMSFFIIPVLLSAMALWLINPLDAHLSQWLLQQLAAVFEIIMPILHSSVAYSGDAQYFSGFGEAEFVALLLAVILLLGPAIMANRMLGFMLLLTVLGNTLLSNLLPDILPAKTLSSTRPVLNMRVLDVGQGLSILIQVEDKVLLYDTGASWGTASMVKWVHRPLLY